MEDETLDPEEAAIAAELGATDEAPIGETAEELAEPGAELVDAQPEAAIPPQYARLIADLQAQGIAGDDDLYGQLDQQAISQHVGAELGPHVERLQAAVDAGAMSEEDANALLESLEAGIEAKATAERQAGQMRQQAMAQLKNELPGVAPELIDQMLAAGIAPEQIKVGLSGALATAKTRAVEQYNAAKKSDALDAGAALPSQGATRPTSPAVDLNTATFEELYAAQRRGR